MLCIWHIFILSLNVFHYFLLNGVVRNPLIIHVSLWRVAEIWWSLWLMKSCKKILRWCISSWDLLKIVRMTSLLSMRVRVTNNLSLALNFTRLPFIIMSQSIFMGNKMKSCLQKSSLLQIPLLSWLMRLEMPSLVNWFYEILIKIGSWF